MKRGTLPPGFVSPGVALARYFDAAAQFSATAEDEAKPFSTRFVAALRLAHLLVEQLPKHPDLARYPRWRPRLESQAALAVRLAESLKLDVRAELLGLVPPQQPQEAQETKEEKPVLAAMAATTTGELLDDTAALVVGEAGGRSGGEQRRVVVAAGLFEAFAACAAGNTGRNVETCGVLCGTLRGGELIMSHVVVPEQIGTSDTCSATDEESLLDAQLRHQLLCLGWIHTHPRHSCFLSSVDLHTSVSYQALLPEALAVVVAPTDAALPVGIFQLTPGGLRLILRCPLRGFHPHAEPQLYGRASHVRFDEAVKPVLLDLRKGAFS